MAFLDNSGDIILDATLTDVGRRRMADGTFSIIKFALGDDEIDYGLYELDHPSGSAYSDLQILQTPIFESITSEASAINHGLLSITRQNLLYLPSLKINEEFDKGCQSSGSVYYLACNSETLTKVTSVPSGRSFAPLGERGKKVINGSLDAPTALEKNSVIYIESGIDTTEETANSSNRHNLIQATNMLDSSFTVSVDERFISNVYQLKGDVAFVAHTDADSVQSVPTTIVTCTGNSTSPGLKDYVEYSVRGVDNLLFAPGSGTRTEISAIAGPRGSGMATKFQVIKDMQNESTQDTPNEFIKYGRTMQTIFGDTNKYDVIDTTVYVRGNSSTAALQIPLRIIRYAGT